MKFSPAHTLTLTIGLAALLPTGTSQSQLAPAVDPMSEIQAMQTVNDDLLKRQDAVLKELTDMTTTANEVRIYSRRG